MTRGVKILRGGGAPKFFGARKEGPEEIRGGGGAPKICILQNQQEGVVGS